MTTVTDEQRQEAQAIVTLVTGLTHAGPAAAPAAAAGRQSMTCTICHEAMNEVHADIGTHPMCDPDPLPATPPPSCLPDLKAALIAWDQGRARSQQEEIGPSTVAVPCDRRLAYALCGTPRTDANTLKWAALVGTAVHAVVAEALVQQNETLGRERWLVEQKVRPDPSILGSCDAYDTDSDTIVDWKVVGKTALEDYRKHGPGQQYMGQVHTYGRGWQRAGKHPRWVRIVFLPRASATIRDAYEWTAPYDRRVAEAALERVFAMVDLIGALDVTQKPENWQAVPAQPGPGCNYCPYLRRFQPADGNGCPGDAAADEQRVATLGDGIIEAS